MRITGIIAEYNPFHCGHEFHIEKAKEATGADFCVVVMSGDFVQRGEPAVFSKYLRTRMALSCGADLVVELPSVFAVSSAEDFAACGVALLSALGAVDTVCFGSEQGELGDIMAAAKLLADESPVFSGLLEQGVKRGLSWPQARNQALAVMADDETFPLDAGRLDGLLASPNNLLGIEYCKAILRSRSPLKAVTIKRRGRGYHDKEMEEGQASASALRRVLLKREGNWEELLSPHVPAGILHLYRGEPAVSAEDFAGLLNYRLLTLVSSGAVLSEFSDLSREMESRLKTRLLEFDGWEGRIRQLKTRQYTYTRVSRALLHVLLGITDSALAQYKSAGYAPYARVLGFKKDSAELLSVIKKQSAVPLITKTADASRLLSGTALSMFHMDLNCAHIRQSILVHEYGYRTKNEFTQPVCIL